MKLSGAILGVAVLTAPSLVAASDSGVATQSQQLIARESLCMMDNLSPSILPRAISACQYARKLKSMPRAGSNFTSTSDNYNQGKGFPVHWAIWTIPAWVLLILFSLCYCCACAPTMVETDVDMEKGGEGFPATAPEVPHFARPQQQTDGAHDADETINNTTDSEGTERDLAVPSPAAVPPHRTSRLPRYSELYGNQQDFERA